MIWYILSAVVSNIVISLAYDEIVRNTAEELSRQLSVTTGKPVLNVGSKFRLVGDVNCDIKPLASGVEYCDARSLPYSDKQFGVVLLSHVLEHIDDPILALREALRVADYVIIVQPKKWQILPWIHPDHKWWIYVKNGKIYFESIGDNLLYCVSKPSNVIVL